MAYEDRLVQMYTHTQNQPAATIKDTLKLKNHVQTNTNCMSIDNDRGRFVLTWKAEFELTTMLMLSTPPNLATTAAFPSPVNRIMIIAYCKTGNPNCS